MGQIGRDGRFGLERRGAELEQAAAQEWERRGEELFQRGEGA